MYTVSEEYKNRIYQHSRTMRAKAAVGGSELTDTDEIQSVSITRPFLADGALIGGAVSAQISVTCLDPGGKLAETADGAALSVSLGLEKEDGAVEWLPFQTVSADTVEQDPDSHTCTVSGFDDMARLDAVTYAELEIPYPATLRQIAAAAAASAGLELDGGPFLLEGQSYTEADPPNLSGSETARQVIGWIAEAALSNAVVNRAGKIQFVSVIQADAPAGTIDADAYFTFEAGCTYGPINTLVLGRVPQEDNVFRQDDEAVAAGGTKELRINDNPFLDGRREEVIDALFAAVNGLTILPYTLDWRGSPAMDPGDTLQVVDSGDAVVSILYGGAVLDFDGGLRADTSLSVESLTETDKSKASSTGEKLRKTTLEVDKANQKITAVVESVEETQEYVNGVVEQVREENSAALEISKDEILNTVSQVYATQTETEALRQEVSSQMAQTAEQVEIRFTQAQEATQQVADDLEADRNERETYIRFTADGMELGKSDSALIARLTNDRLSFLENGREVAYVSNNKLYITQAEILDNIHLGSFAFVPRENGNLSLVWKG